MREECELFLKADDGEWRLFGYVSGKLTVSMPPLECEELRILLKGKGICEIKSIDRVFEVVGQKIFSDKNISLFYKNGTIVGVQATLIMLYFRLRRRYKR